MAQINMCKCPDISWKNPLLNYPLAGIECIVRTIFGKHMYISKYLMGFGIFV